MFNNSHMSVSVSGGTYEENAQLVSVIHQSLYNNGFTGVEMSVELDVQSMPLISQLRLINPELFDTKIIVSAMQQII